MSQLSETAMHELDRYRDEVPELRARLDAALKRVRCLERAAAALTDYRSKEPEAFTSFTVDGLVHFLGRVLNASKPHRFTPAPWCESECSFCGEAKNERRHT